MVQIFDSPLEENHSCGFIRGTHQTEHGKVSITSNNYIVKMKT